MFYLILIIAIVILGVAYIPKKRTGSQSLAPYKIEPHESPEGDATSRYTNQD